MNYSLSALRKLARDPSIDERSITKYAKLLFNQYKRGNAPQSLLKAAESFIINDDRSHTCAGFSELFDYETPAVSEGCSVVIPCYNCESTLANTVDSVLASENNDLLEIILVDDCANMATKKIIKTFANKFTCITTISHKTNAGLGAARNSGIRSAKKPFITFLDSDDLMIKGGIYRRMNALVGSRNKFNKSVIGAYGGSLTISEATITAPKTGKINNQKIVTLASTGSDCPFNANQPLFLTEFLSGGFNFPEDRRTAEDWPYWISLLKTGAIIVPTHQYDVTYRDVANSMIRKTSFEHLKFSLNFLSSESSQIHSNNLLGYSSGQVRLQITHEARFYAFAGMAFACNYSNSTLNTSKLAEDLVSLFENNFGPVYLGLKLECDHIKAKLIAGIKRYYCDEFPLEIEVPLENFANCLSILLIESSSAFITTLSLRRHLQYDLAFFPHKEYHVQNIHAIEKELPENITTCVVDFSIQYRDEGVSSYPFIDQMRSKFFSYNEFCLKNVETNLAICFNDWDPVVKQILFDLKAKSNTHSLGIVEGVNDYLDVDTGRPRFAYQTVEHLIVPGEFEKKYFPDHKNLYLGGIQRLDSIETPKISSLKGQDRIDVVINSNFSYNVLVDKQDYWLNSVCSACSELDLSYTISRHPQDGILFPKKLTGMIASENLYSLLAKSKVFITRFSGAIFESIKMGVEVIYYNPDIEKIEKFNDPLGAYQYASSQRELTNHLNNVFKNNYRSVTENFMKLHANIGTNLPTSSKQTAESISKILDNLKD